ncbi:MAG: hup, partial [Modestobacter sp.]|nr:hup [Modestobacter sp.]
MNKAEIVSAIAQRADVPATTVDSVIDGLREELVEAITRGEKVAVPGLLTVERSQRSA